VPIRIPVGVAVFPQGLTKLLAEPSLGYERLSPTPDITNRRANSSIKSRSVFASLPNNVGIRNVVCLQSSSGPFSGRCPSIRPLGGLPE